MKINYCRSTNSFTLKGLTAQQLTVLYAVIKTADDRCFRNRTKQERGTVTTILCSRLTITNAQH